MAYHHYAHAPCQKRMRVLLAAFSGGVVVAHAAPLSEVAVMIVGIGGGTLLCVRAVRPVALFALGLAWGSWAISDAMSNRMSRCAGPLEVELTIRGLPARSGDAYRFEGELAEAADCGLEVGDRVRLSWVSEHMPRPGQRWRMVVKANPARAYVNPHAFDYERWLMRRDIVATGYVVDAELAADTRDTVSNFRLRLRERIETMTISHAGLILALATGDAALVPTSAWRLFRDTSTVHLLVISGLHIGMFGALGLAFGNLIGRILPLTRRFRARGVSGLVAIAAVLAYATLAGWSLPVTRASIMAGVGIFAMAIGRRIGALDGLALALATVLAVDPMAPLDTGFWLSFAAVGVLIAFFAPRAPRRTERTVLSRLQSRAAALILAQLVICVGFAPWLGIFSGDIQPFALFANLVLIPLVASAAAPLSVVGVLALPLAPTLAEMPLAVADSTLGVVMWIVERVGEVPTVPASNSVAALAAATALSLAFLLPWSHIARCALAAAMFSTLTLLDRVPEGRFDLIALDVGQGTSALVRTRNHALIYDAGPRYPSGYDAGDAIVAPVALREHGRGITQLVLSHADIDHMGGATAVLTRLDVRGISAGEPAEGISARPCRRGDAWLWDGVRFRVLWPPGPAAGNDASCVIEIDDGEHRAILTGDVGSAAERRIDVRPVRVMVAPHHGSRTSSSAAFVARACPRVAIFSAGFRNRFGHPHPEVVERYRSIGAHLVTTGDLGAIRWRSDASASLTAARDDWRYWRSGRRPAMHRLDRASAVVRAAQGGTSVGCGTGAP